MKRLFVVCLVLTSLASGVAQAVAPLPVLDSAVGSGPRWVSYKFTTDGSRATLEIGAVKLSRAEFLALYLYDANDALKGGLGWISVGWKSGASFDLPVAGIHIGQVDSPKPDGSMRIILSMNGPASGPPLIGTYKVLMVAAGDAQAWDYALRGGGLTDVAKDTGDSAFFYLADDFDSIASVRAHEILPIPTSPLDVSGFSNIGARASVGARKSLTIADTLIVDFSSAAFGPSQTFSVAGPNGTTDCGFFGCGFNAFQGKNHHGAGAYTFTTSGANAGLSYMAELTLCGADARLP